MDAFALWLRATDVSSAIRALPWFWPLLEILHLSRERCIRFGQLAV